MKGYWKTIMNEVILLFGSIWFKNMIALKLDHNTEINRTEIYSK